MKNTRYDISIVCPTYNSGRTIRNLIQSILSQDFCSYELIFIDGGSTDDTLSIFREYSHCLKYISEKDGGIYDAMNKGIALSSGNWIYFIGSDDALYDKESLMNLQKYLQLDIDVILCKVFIPGYGTFSSTFSGKIWLKNTIFHQGAIYNRKIFDTYKYNTKYRISSDYELNLYLWVNKCRFINADVMFASYSREGISNQVKFSGYKEEIEIRKEYMKNSILCNLLSLWSLYRYLVRKVLRFFKIY